jgi:hypothetical protein
MPYVAEIQYEKRNDQSELELYRKS